MTPMRRPRSITVLSVVFALLALNAWAQVVLAAADYSGDPIALILLQTAVGAAAAATAWGSWRMRWWSPHAAIAYGVVTAAMLLALDPLLDLGPEARSGLWSGAVVVLLLGSVAAWYLRRALARGRS